MNDFMFLFYGFNQITFLSWIELSFIVLGVIGLVLIFQVNGLLLKKFNLLLCLALAVFILSNRTEFPNIHGDGEDGYISVKFNDQFNIWMVKDFPAQNGRLQSYLHWAADSLPQAQYSYHRSWLTQPQQVDHRNLSWISMTLALGLISCFVAFIITLVTLPQYQRFISGMLLLIGWSPYMLNAMGHFDSYIVAVTAGMFWLGCVWLYYKWGEKKLHYVLLLGVSGLAMFAHPGNFFYVIGTIMLIKHRAVYFLGVILLLAATWNHLDVSTLSDKPNWMTGTIPFGFGLIKHIHLRGMAMLQETLPAIVLGLLCIRSINTQRQKAGVVMALMAIISSFIFSISYGIIDELAYSVFGLVVFCGIAMACQKELLVQRAVYAGLLSFVLFVASGRVYSDSRIMDREYRSIRFETCNTIRELSPYVSMGLRHPIDTPELKQHRLAIFKEGMYTPVNLYNTQQTRMICLYYYTAWSLEFKDYEQAVRGLQIYEDNGMLNQMVPIFFNPDTAFVWRSSKTNMVDTLNRVIRIR
jgi:hypothetical protein